MLSALALLWQVLVVQTHVHAPATPGVGTVPVAEHRQPDDVPAICPLCQALSHAGSYVSPAGVTIAVPAPAFGMVAAAPFAARIALRPPQGWRNRGPPVSEP